MPPDLLSLVLSRYPAHVRPVNPPEPLRGYGGLSGASLWRYQAPAGWICVRAWPMEASRIEHLNTIHGWLREAADLGFLPIPVPARDGQTVQECEGRCWQVEPWLDGVPDLAHPPANERVQAAFRALATLHQRLSRHTSYGVSPGLGLCIRELEGLTAQGFDRLEAALDHAPPSLPHPARRWLALARATAPHLHSRLLDPARLRVPLQPCLRDARPEHFLFEGERLSGLVDFGAMGIDSVAADLARLVGEWFPGDASLRALALAAYEQIRPLDPTESALIAPFEAAADLLIAGHWLRWHLLEHRRFADPGAVAHGVLRGLVRLARLAARMRPKGLLA
jgi:homoserine kinase type II